MQTGTQRGLSSELFESLKVYLNNSKRLQPIIGLRSITECVKAGSRGGGEPVYLCDVCACRLSKGDMRNHIMGSIHRYNYTATRHPQLLSGVKQSDADMSLLAWPLMDIARMLEDQEGPGDIKLLEVEDATFEMLKGASDSDAINLSKLLMYGPAKPESLSNDKHDEEERVVTICHNEEQLADGDGSSWAEETTPSFGHILRDRYKGKKPLIGLFRVTECVCQEDRRTYCFLCHCCRTRVHTRVFIHHVSSSSHTRSYLMETRHKLVEAAGPNVADHTRLMDSLAERVEREEGRGDMEVVEAPQFLCGKLASKGYKWCVNRLWNRSYPTARKWNKAKTAGGPKVKNVGGKNQVVFKVTLPLTEGPLLLERTSFSQESLPRDHPNPDLDSELADPVAEVAFGVSHQFDPPINHPSPEWQTEPPVAREWFNSAYAQWHDWSLAEKQENQPQANLPPVATNAGGHHAPPTEFQSIPVVRTPSWTQPYLVGSGGFPGYQGYGVPLRLHPPPYVIPPSFYPTPPALPEPL
ncbi:uncharacterized protein si:ch211-199g17.2 isoform X1 [Syngnathus scovelli]|uniref:uncharacterized protein si:ch211-199g17.2 isoform X1 n=1 Tax=Syngnathus scovelli TaxID=161590 RepID=UPI00210FFA3A|nr:uncharacterized protein si:ch211-199g17.2 isoform X1 [Syngnathus scovelli]XP_049606138.1 uncharacterized protein si:ch211-199g17.2 isoform X1 [Syngnathus scovelli]